MTDAPLTVTDTLGRVITYRIIDPGDTLDLLEAAGTASTAQGFMQYAMIVASAVSIQDVGGSDVPLPRITTRDGLRAAGKQLKNEGVIALSKRLFEGDTTPAEQVETAKNSADTP